MDSEFILKHQDLFDEFKKYSKYKGYDDSYMLSKMPEMEKHKKEIERLKIDLGVLNEQEGEEVDTTQEMSKVQYWENMIDNHNRNNLSSIEAVERQLAQMKQRFQSVMIYYEGRLKTAKEVLEKKQSKKSKSHIRLNYKINELQEKVDKYNEDCRGCGLYREIEAKIQKALEAHKKKKLKDLSNSYQAPAPAPTEVKPQHPPVIQNTKKTPKLAPKMAIKEPQSESSD